MQSQSHWNGIYSEKAQDQISWYRPHLETSLRLIQQAAPARTAAIIDVGGGESTLVDDLLALGYKQVSVLDISGEAIQVAMERLGASARKVEWLVADITQAILPEQHYALWHDRAVFHFLIEPHLRAAYIRRLLNSLMPGGNVVIATFGPAGPEQCSGLPVVRYDARTLQVAFGPRFALMDACTEEHVTPAGKRQQFLYAWFRLGGKGVDHQE